MGSPRCLKKRGVVSFTWVLTRVPSVALLHSTQKTSGRFSVSFAFFPLTIYVTDKIHIHFHNKISLNIRTSFHPSSLLNAYNTLIGHVSSTRRRKQRLGQKFSNPGQNVQENLVRADRIYLKILFLGPKFSADQNFRNRPLPLQQIAFRCRIRASYFSKDNGEPAEGHAVSNVVIYLDDIFILGCMEHLHTLNRVMPRLVEHGIKNHDSSSYIEIDPGREIIKKRDPRV